MKLTKEFVEGFLERYDGDLSGPILDIAGSADPVGSLLEYLNRKDIIEWLQYEFDGLLMHGFQPAQDLELPERKNSELLLAFLETTKAENSRGLECGIKSAGDPEELYTPEKYIQEYVSAFGTKGTSSAVARWNLRARTFQEVGRRIRSVANLIARTHTTLKSPLLWARCEVSPSSVQSSEVNESSPTSRRTRPTESHWKEDGQRTQYRRSLWQENAFEQSVF